MKIESKTYNKNELLDQIKSFISDNLIDKEFVINDITLECKYNWIGENDNIRYKILASRDYEIVLKVKGL